MLTREQRDGLRKLHAEATAAPWKAGVDCFGDAALTVTVTDEALDMLIQLDTDIVIERQADWQRGRESKEYRDAALAAAARNALPDLLDAADRLEEENARLQERLDALEDRIIVAALSGLPELTPEERAAMDSLPPDFVERIIRGRWGEPGVS